MDQVTWQNVKQTTPYQLKLFKAVLMSLIALGLIISFYLFNRQLNVAGANAKIDVCAAVFGKGCDQALQSHMSTQLGLPLSGWGVMYYATLFLLILLSPADAKIRHPALTALSIIIIAGAAISLSLLVLMILNPALFCPFCSLIHLINLCLAFFASTLTGYSLNKSFKKNAGLNLMDTTGATQPRTSGKLLSVLLPILFAATLYYGLSMLLTRSSKLNAATFDARQYVTDHFKQPQTVIPVFSDDHISGLNSSPLQIIVFSDFQCSGCRYFSQLATHLQKKYANKIKVVFKHFPLGTTCNKSIDQDIHPRACEAAWAAEAAARQGKFWEFHDAVFKIDLQEGNETLCSISEKLGLNHKQFEQERLGKAAKNKVAKNVQLAKQLGINYTPAVYLNDRLVNDIRLQPMQILIETYLAKQH